jgi:putative hemolysin
VENATSRVDALSVRRSREFHPLCSLDIRVSGYRVSTVESWREFLNVLRLRSEVFRSEYGVENSAGLWDFEELDGKCDHLIVSRLDTGAIVGTYRILRFDGSECYSASEFVLDSLLSRPGSKLEIGRACIDERYRNGTTLHLLWRGLAEYVKASGADTVFGCASFKTEKASVAARLFHSLRRAGYFHEGPPIDTTQEFRMNGFEEELSRAELEDHKLSFEMVPPLFQVYLKAGAKIMSYPAHDRVFHCIDFLTMLDVKFISSSFSRRYGL